MKSFRRNDVIVLILERGEELVSSVVGFCKEEDIEAAYITGLGALTDITLGYFDVDNMDYKKKSLEGYYELINLKGDITSVENDLILHAHVTLGGPDFKLTGGHLFRGTVSVTGEIFIYPLEGKLTRKRDSFTGLDLIES